MDTPPAKKLGRPKKAPRYKINLLRIEDGKTKHLFSVMSTRSVTELLKALQELRTKT